MVSRHPFQLMTTQDTRGDSFAAPLRSTVT
jgi:hypothetical protein